MRRPSKQARNRCGAGETGAPAERLGICMLIQSYYPRVGGAETNLQALIPLLRRRGMDVMVVTRRYPGMAGRATVAGGPVYRMPMAGGRIGRSLSFTLASLEFVARHRRGVDVIHAHELLSPTTAAVLAKMVLGRPVVAQVIRGGLLGDVAVLRKKELGYQRLW